MRTILYNANIITGDGETILENRCLLLRGEFIEGIGRVAYPYYEDADQVIDAQGGFVIPGIINAHTHCITTGPAPCSTGCPGVSKYRVRQNLNKHLLEGTTTIVSHDGFTTANELEEARNLTPMLVQTLTHHLPLHFKDAELIEFGGLKEKHKRTTVEDMISKGALGIGEIGGLALGIDTETGKPDRSYYDPVYIPFTIKRSTGITISSQESRRVREALFAEPPNIKEVTMLLKKLNILRARRSLEELVKRDDQHVKLVVESYEEAAATAKKLGIPLFMHIAPQTKIQALDFAQRLGNLFIGLHCNFLFKPSEAIVVATEIRRAGGWVEVITMDTFGAKRLGVNHITTLALLAEGLVNLIGTDYAGGFWDSIPRVLEYAIEQNVMNLPQAVALITKNVTKILPNVAPSRGYIAEGKMADLAILSRERISDVRTVIIGGNVVVHDRRIAPIS